MDDDGEYNDGDIVWVKLSYCWWPGEVKAGDSVTEDLLSTLKRRPLAVVKFFEEDSYEYVKNTNFIYKYNCSRKHEFLRKGLDQYRAKNKHMEKFPADIMHAERATGGDPNIVNSKDFLPHKRESYADIFGDKTKGRASAGKAAGKKVVSPSKATPVIPVKKHEVRILGQASSSSGLNVSSRSLSSSLASASSLPSTPKSAVNTSSQNSSVDDTLAVSSSLASPAQLYHCHKCGFESGRQNVIVIHTKYCRAVPMSIPSVKVAKPVPITPEKIEPDTTQKTVESPRKLVASTPKTEIEEKIEKIAEDDELVEVIQVVEPVKPTRSGRTPRAAAPAPKSTPKVDRRRNRGKGRAAAVPVDADNEEKVEVFMEVSDEKEEVTKEEDKTVEKEIEVEKGDESVDKDDSKDSKGKGELKNELLADWSEDEQDDQEDSAKEDEVVKNDEEDKFSKVEHTSSNSLEVGLEKSVDCSPQLASPVSSGTTIKYRNIPKKQKREFIEVTNDQPAAPVTSTVEKSSSESSISTTAATCGGDTTLNTSEKTPISNDSFSERPISAKQRILDRATRGSSKSISSDDTKQESSVKPAAPESQSTTDDDPKKETSCFDFKEDEEEEVVLNKSPRRSLSNRRDTSLELSSSVVDPAKEQEELERAKKDADLKSKIESLLCETNLPSLPEIPRIPKAPSPGPSSSTETTPQLKEELDRNRTLPPKERGKRIFKTRNKIIENEAIALEQSKAIVMDFVKKSHEEELAELLELQRAKAKLSSESPTTTNDDSQESVLSSNEPTRFENSEFAAIKSKRTKISQAEKVLALSAQEPSVSSTDDTKAADTIPVSISTDQLALESLPTTATPPKGRKGKQRKSGTPVIEKPVEETEGSEAHVEHTTPKGRKKRGVEHQNPDTVELDVPSSATVVIPELDTDPRVKEVTPRGRKKRGVEHQSSDRIELDVPSSAMVESPKPEPELCVKEATPRGRKKRGVEQHSPDTVELDVPSSAMAEIPEPEPEPSVKEATPRGRKKRGVEHPSPDTVELDVPSSAMMEIPEPEPESCVKEATSRSRKKRGLTITEHLTHDLACYDEVGETVEKVPEPIVESSIPKGRKKRGAELQNLDQSLVPKSEETASVAIEKTVEVTSLPQTQEHVADATPKNRKKRGVEVQSSDLVPEPFTTKDDKPLVETVEPEAPVVVTTPKGRKKRSSDLQNLDLVASDSLRVVVEKPLKESPEPASDHLAAETTPKNRRKRGGAVLCSESPVSATSEPEKVSELPEPEAVPYADVAMPKSRKKRSSELQNLELMAQDTLRVVITREDEEMAEAQPQPDIPDVSVKKRNKRGAEVHKVEESTSLLSEKKLEETSIPESNSHVSVVSPKGRKKRSDLLENLEVAQDIPIPVTVVVEKSSEEIPEPETKQSAHVVDTPHKGRKKRGVEVQKAKETDSLVTPRSEETPNQELDSHLVSPRGRKKRDELHESSDVIKDSPIPVAEVVEKSAELEPSQSGHAVDTPHKGRKKRGGVLHINYSDVVQQTPVAEMVEKSIEEAPQSDLVQHAEHVDKPHKGRRKKVNEVPSSELTEGEKLVVEASEPDETCVKAAIPKDEQKEREESMPADSVVSGTSHPATSVVDKPIEDPREPEAELQLEAVTTPKVRRKRGGELDKLDLRALDTPRSRRGKDVKIDESAVVPEEPVKVESPILPEKHSKLKRTNKAEEVNNENLPRPDQVEDIPNSDTISPVVEELKEEPKTIKSKRIKQPQPDSTAEDIPMATEPPVPTNERVEPDAPVEQPESSPVIKQQPIKMIIKSRGRKSNSELLYEPTVIVSPETKEDEVKEKLPKSPKSSKRKKTPVEEPVDSVLPMPVDTPIADTVNESKSSVKSPKHKRSKMIEEQLQPAIDEKIPEEMPQARLPSGPTDTDLQIAEALIHLPDATPPKPIAGSQETLVDTAKPNSSSSSPVLTAKTINPRKRHLQALMISPELTEQPNQVSQVETVTIPEKKKRETAQVVVETVQVDKTGPSPMEEDKFDIDNIPIVMDDCELMGESAISTTTTNSQKPTEAAASPAKPMTKKMIIVKSSNGSARIISPKESREVPPPLPKKKLGIKSSTTTIKPPVDQLSPQPTRSPTHSPPIRGAQLVQASSVGQIVITSKGTVFTTQSPTTSTATKLSRSGSPKSHHVTPSKPGSIVSSVSSVSTISSSTSKSSPLPPASPIISHRSVIPDPSPICVQSQEIIYPSAKSRSSTTKPHDSSPMIQKKTSSSSIASPPKKALMKKHTDASSPTSSGKPLFSTSKGNPITPQPATSSAASSGKKAHKVIKISPQKLKEFTRLGMVEDKGQGKVLTASGMKKFRQEQYQLQKQQRSRPDESKKLPRADSGDEEPSTSTPTPPPPSETMAEVVVAAAADSSVKEISPISAETEESTEVELAASSTESIEIATSAVDVITLPEPSSTEENEADAAVNEPEAESSSLECAEAEVSSPPDEALEAPVAAAVEVAPEASESGSNVQESSQLIAVPAENFGGPSNLFYLCAVREEGFVPVNNELLYLDSSNQLVALPENASVEDIVNQAEVLEIPTGSDQATMVTGAATVDAEGGIEVGQQNILLNTQDGQQIILDQQSLMALAAGGDTSQLLTPDGQQILLQGSAQELLAALAVSQPGLGIVAAEGTQIIVAPESLIELQDPPLPGEIIQVNPNTTVETNAVLTKPPIMSAVEVPTKNGAEPSSVGSPEQKSSEAATPSNLDESLAAVIGVQGNPNVPTSLELPITVTNPVIAKTTTSKINPIYPTTTAISAIALDPAAVAAAGTVIGLPTVAQTDSLTAIKSIWD